MINGMKNPSPPTIGQIIAMVNGCAARAIYHGTFGNHPRFSAYSKAWQRRRDREGGIGYVNWNNPASASLICLTGRLIDVMEVSA